MHFCMVSLCGNKFGNGPAGLKTKLSFVILMYVIWVKSADKIV